MSKRVKELMAGELAKALEDQDSCVLVGLGKLDVASATELRTELREEGMQLRVLKNRVATHALKDKGWDSVAEHLAGPTALAYGEGGALTASKILVGWSRKAPGTISIRGGFLDGRLLDVDGVKRLATIPDKPTLYSMLASAVAAPVTQVASLVSEVLAGVARAVGAVAEQRQSE
ncbi:MAG: 50S ribosomal protein L10 [Planctomycetota bacterium]|jgi:large subunit ribosomal protein L10